MSAMYILAVAAVTPFYAPLFDRFGQRRVGPVALGVQIVAMLAFALAALALVPIPVLFALAICMGLTQFSFHELPLCAPAGRMRCAVRNTSRCSTPRMRWKRPSMRSYSSSARFWRRSSPPRCTRCRSCSCPRWPAASGSGVLLAEEHRPARVGAD